MYGLSMGGATPEYNTRGRIIWGLRLGPGPEILYIWGTVLEVPMDSLELHEGGRLVMVPARRTVMLRAASFLDE